MRLHIEKIGRIIHNIKERGVIHTIRLLWDYLFFDLRHGTKTGKPIRLSDLNIHSSNKALGKRYNPTLTPIFLDTLKYLVPDVYKGRFVDFGCGKGRILIAAAECGFKKVVGIEFSEQLFQICTDNINTLSLSNVEVLYLDATRYVIPEDTTVLFLFYPFEYDIFKIVLENMRLSLQKCWRTAYIIYVEPEIVDTYLPRDEYRLVHSMKSSLGRDANIYEIMPRISQ